MRVNILVCGGAGYIGSHMTKWLATRGVQVTELDNFSTGHRAAVQWGHLLEADLMDAAAVERVFSEQRFDAVIHLCALSIVGDSVQRPYDYYANNVGGTLNLLRAMQRYGVSKLVFSSTAAVYGQPQQARIDEQHPTQPINPYGSTKLMCERILADAARAYGLRSVCLRYFNAAGATEDGDIGEAHEPETHLIPNILRALRGDGAALKLFGDDYPTADGTCVRDYVHVDDLAQAHERALHYLDGHDGAHVFNLGSDVGFSVREVIASAERVTGRRLAYETLPRREGDPAILVANSRRAREVLGWQPAFVELDDIIASAWRWHSAQRF